LEVLHSSFGFLWSARVTIIGFDLSKKAKSLV
jgi:hypothetical protein